MVIENELKDNLPSDVVKVERKVRRLVIQWLWSNEKSILICSESLVKAKQLLHLIRVNDDSVFVIKQLHSMCKKLHGIVRTSKGDSLLRKTLNPFHKKP